MPEPACLNGTLPCAELLALLNSGFAVAVAVGFLVSLVLGMAFVRSVWS